MNLNELKIAELKALYALIRERDAEIEKMKERILWLEQQGNEAYRVPFLEAEIERLTKENKEFRSTARFREIEDENKRLKERLSRIDSKNCPRCGFLDMKKVRENAFDVYGGG